MNIQLVSKVKTTYFLVIYKNSFRWVELISILREEMPVSQAAVQWLTDLEIPGMIFWLGSKILIMAS